jgi:hypothetical protein
MRVLLFCLFLSLPVWSDTNWPYYQVQKGDSFESISLSLYGNTEALKKTTPTRQLPPPGKYIRISPQLLRLKCNIGSAPRFLKFEYRMREVKLVYAHKTFYNSKDLREYIKGRSECLDDLKPWRKLQYLSYAVAVDGIEEKNDDVSTQTRVTAFAGLEYYLRREIGWVEPWVAQLRGRLLKGDSAKGYSLGPQIDFEAGLGKEIQRNSQVLYAKLWRSQLDFVGEDPDAIVTSYSTSTMFLGAAYEYIHVHENRPWIGELGAYYKIAGDYTPEVNGEDVKLGGFALRASVRVPFEIEGIENLFAQPSWQYMNLTGEDYGLFINQFALSLGMKF